MPNSKTAKLAVCLACITALLLCPIPCMAQKFVVLCQDLPDNSDDQRLISETIKGIAEGLPNHTLLSIKVTPKTDAYQLATGLQQQGISGVVALGSVAARLIQNLSKSAYVVVGSVVTYPGEYPRADAVVSWVVSPAAMIKRLQKISPKTQRVFVVYNPSRTGWMIKIARETAAQSGVDLIALEATDLRSALLAYRVAMLTAADGDAIWLPDDKTITGEKTLLNFVLEEVWGRRLVLFSNDVRISQLGGVFAVRPDPRAHGRDIAEILHKGTAATSTTRDRGVFTTAKDGQLAVNHRTASYLGLQNNVPVSNDPQLIR